MTILSFPERRVDWALLAILAANFATVALSLTGLLWWLGVIR